ncbi:hypothetical protein ASPFODRAFT_493635 [Aspergillus luchuensis CBS 106.47]|uniref:Uncharacterized protein n=1 Tax=Aspergillus luchuensis (strain CBS 106.47) TaxID=1137211 RepID=A0A1M3TS11_ASPLC|nr:hypothetical protein ASPFODRAFT_493635 [Aspergillus luchuensis CBS 106.47]
MIFLCCDRPEPEPVIRTRTRQRLGSAPLETPLTLYNDHGRASSTLLCSSFVSQRKYTQSQSRNRLMIFLVSIKCIGSETIRRQPDFSIGRGL